MSPSDPRDVTPEVPEEELSEEREADDSEQADTPSRGRPTRIPIDAPEADALEQSLPADLDEDEGR